MTDCSSSVVHPLNLLCLRILEHLQVGPFWLHFGSPERPSADLPWRAMALFCVCSNGLLGSKRIVSCISEGSGWGCWGKWHLIQKQGHVVLIQPFHICSGHYE